MIDIKEARSRYCPKSGLFFDLRDHGFTQYAHAYVTSNENMSELMDVMRPQGKSVLAVAGSGDQPVFFKLHDAAHIDSFDVSYCAKVIMDLKTAAIQSVPYEKYIGMLRFLQNDSRQITDFETYRDIKHLCPDETQQFIKDMSGCKICRGGGHLYFENIPSREEYATLSAKITEPFNFIWSDLRDLHKKLTRPYDQIYLSNIMQYHMNYDFACKTVHNLLDFVTPGGTILFYSAPYFTHADRDVFTAISPALSKYVSFQLSRYKNSVFYVMKKL